LLAAPDQGTRRMNIGLFTAFVLISFVLVVTGSG
jgi:hypothetical protein